MKVTRFAVLAATAAIVFSACSGSSGGSGGAGSKGTLDVWTSLPMQGSAKGSSESMINAAKLALEKRGGVVAGWTINYQPQDDSTADAGKWTPEKETDNATRAVSNDKLVAYVGTYNSGAAKIAIPILCAAGLVMVSPANTYPGLTKPGKGEADEPGKYYSNCKDGVKNFVRVTPSDDLQSPVAAQWAKDLGAKKVFVLDDTEIYGKGAADAFEAAATQIGLTVLGHAQAPGKSTDYKALAAKIKDAGPELIYYGGVPQNNSGQLWKDIKEALPDVKMMGPDGMYQDAFITGAGAAAEGTYFTFGGLDPATYTGDAAAFRDAYKAKYGDAIDTYAIYTYESMNIVLDAIQKAVDGGAKDAAAIRAAVLKNITSIKDYKGVLGTWSFDENGDTSLTTFGGVQVKSGKYVFVSQLELAK